MDCGDSFCAWELLGGDPCDLAFLDRRNRAQHDFHLRLVDLRRMVFCDDRKTNVNFVKVFLDGFDRGSRQLWIHLYGDSGLGVIGKVSRKRLGVVDSDGLIDRGLRV